MITIGSLFSGVGGLDLGLEHGLAAAGIHTRTLWQVEQNDYARAVLARHWPHAERYTDVRTITASSVPPVDLLCGGFPCQDISVAGNGAGLAGARSGLFFEMVRVIRELRPRIVVLENVSAITSRGLDTVLGEMAALGYDARWGGLRASEVGAPHRRERWFCVGWLADAPRHGWATERASRGEDGEPRHRRTGLADADRRDSSQRPDLRSDRHEEQPPASGAGRARGAGQTQSRVGGDAHGIPGRLDGHRWPPLRDLSTPENHPGPDPARRTTGSD